MKKTFTILMLLLGTVALTAITSCGDDDPAEVVTPTPEP